MNTDDLMDLLDAKSDKKLRIRQNFQTDTTQVENLSKVDISSPHDFDISLQKAIGNRITAKHALNAVSSRSHMLVMLSVEQQMIDASVRISRLNFGDLAGSEDVTKALGPNPDPERLKEAIAINSSLSALTTAISLLSKGQRPSFRSSALTYILQDSLGGNSKTTMVVNASPHIRNRPETIRTLRFAETAKKVKNKAKVNDRLTRAQLERKIIELEAENAQLRAQLVDWGGGGVGHGPSDSMMPMHLSGEHVISPQTSITMDPYSNSPSGMTVIIEEAIEDEVAMAMAASTAVTAATGAEKTSDNNTSLDVSHARVDDLKPAQHKQVRSMPEPTKVSILDVDSNGRKRSGSHFHAVSAPYLSRNKDVDESLPFISSTGLMRHASLTTGLAVIQP
ncbi:hypothetical protein RFI_24431, partial [Reticulomyxa filosa]